MRFRRLCVDVDDWGAVIGGSCEYHDDEKRRVEAFIVLAPGELKGLSRHQALDVVEQFDWKDVVLPFEEPPPAQF